MSNKMDKKVKSGSKNGVDTAVSESFTEEDKHLCRNSILLYLRVMGTGVELIDFSDEAIDEAMADDGLFVTYIQILKLLVIDEDLEKSRTKMREAVIKKISQGLLNRNHPQIKQLLQSPIIYEALPKVPGFSAKQINSIRPKLLD